MTGTSMTGPAATEKPGLFISYAHRDSNPDFWRDGKRPGWDAKAFNRRMEDLIQRLKERGVEVYWDRTHLDDFESIKRFMQDNLPRSRAMLTFYSTLYPTRRACQWELTAAYIAGCADAREGERPADAVERRILVINPEPDKAHILPEDLTERLFAELSAKTDLEALADKIVSKVTAVSGGLARVRPGSAKQLRIGDMLRIAPSRFVGRIREMWKLQSVLAADGITLRSASAGGMSGAAGVVILNGMGGMGKSMLALEYALRFADAWPGGLIWLYAGGDANSIAGTGRESTGSQAPDAALLQDRLTQNYRTIAMALGLKIEGLEPEYVIGMTRAALAERGPYLWIVDDLPGGVSSETVKAWAAPSTNGASLFTTRDRRQTGLGEPVTLEVLDEEAAWELLTAEALPRTDADADAAKEILKKLGRHALAVDVAGHLMGEHFTWEEFLDLLTDPEADAFDLARDTGLELPNGHEVSIVETLKLSLGRLPQPALEMLAIACQMAPNTPIPRDFLTACFLRSRDNPETEETTDALPAKQSITTVSGKDNMAAKTAIAHCARLSLMEADPESLVIHPVVKRVMQLTSDPDRASIQRRSSMVEMHAWLEDRVEDNREHKHIAALIPHAESLGLSGDGLHEAGLLSSVSDFYVAAGDYAAAHALQENCVAYVQGALGDTHPDSLNSMGGLANVLFAMGDFKAAHKIEEKVLRLKQKILGKDHPDTLTAMDNFSGTLGAMGDFKAAQEILKSVLQKRRAILGEDHPDTLAAMNNLAETLRAMGDLKAAQEIQETTLRMRKEILGEYHPNTLESMNNLAATLLAMGDLTSAWAIEEKVLRMRKEILGKDHPDTLAAMNNLAEILRAMGDFKAARDIQETTLRMMKEILGKDHPLTLKAMNNLAETLRAMGDFKAARDIQKTTLRMMTEILGKDHPDTLKAMNNLAGTLRAMGDFKAARDIQKTTLRMMTEILGKDHPDTLAVMNNLAETLRAMGDFKAAREIQETTLRMMKEILGKDHPLTLTAMNNLAATLLAMSELKAARDIQKTVLQRLTEILGKDHPDTLTAAHNLSYTLREMGDLKTARNIQETVLQTITETLGKDHPRTLEVMDNLAQTFYAMGDFDDACGLREKALQLYTETLGEDHPLTLHAIHNLALTLTTMGRPEEARGLQETVLPRMQEILGNDHPSALLAENNLAVTMHAMGETEDARIRQEALMRHCQDALGDKDRATLRVTQKLALMLRDLGEKDEARRLGEQVLAVWSGEGAPDQRWLDELQTFLGEL